MNRATIAGKRIAALDYGLRRIGFAVCDELHITVSPRGFFDNAPNFWDKFMEALERERIEVVVVGIPYRHDNSRSEMIIAVEQFVEMLKQHISQPVYVFDEAFSTVKAYRTMEETSMKLKKRRQAGKKDEIAAAIILREFIEETERV